MFKQSESLYSVAGLNNSVSSMFAENKSISTMSDLSKSVSSMLEQNESLNSMIGLSKSVSSIFEQNESLNSIMGMSKSVSSMLEQNERFTSMDGFNKSVGSTSELSRQIELNTSLISNLNFENTYIKENLEPEITENEKTLLKDFLDSLSESFPEVKSFIQSLETKNYNKLIIASLIFVFFKILPMYFLIQNNFLDNQQTNNLQYVIEKDIHYKVNGKNVRVRLTPTTISKQNIIKKLDNNIYVKKIVEKNGWIKVLFELKDGIYKKGWINRKLLTKVDN